MGEAWFMSAKRRMYPLLLGALDAVDDGEIASALEQTATGPGSFGQYEEWTVGFHYLLPRLVARDRSLESLGGLEVLFTGFMAQHPSEDGAWPYPQFRTDALATLGRLTMAPRFWPGDPPEQGENPERCFRLVQGGRAPVGLAVLLRQVPAGR